MREIKRREIGILKHGKRWIRQGKVEKAIIEAMEVSLRTHGQKVPIIIYGDEVIDGNVRKLAGPGAGLTHLDAIEVDHELSEVELIEMQLTIEQRSNVPTTQRAAGFAALQQAAKYTVTELAGRHNLTQPMMSKLLHIHNKGSDQIKAMLDAGLIDIEKAAMLCGCTDPAVIEAAPFCSRDQVRQKVNGNAKPEVKASSVSLALAGDFTVMVRGPINDMPTLVEVLGEATKQARRAMAKGHTLGSVGQYFKRFLGGNDKKQD